MNAFEENFVNELDEFIRNIAEHYHTIGVWKPAWIAAPERHIWNSMHAASMDASTVYEALERNEAYHKIANYFHIYFDMDLISDLASKKEWSVDVEKEQVWLFAYYTFSKYITYLLDVQILRTKFYREKHDTFMDLLGKMLVYNPEKRIDFNTAYKLWCGEAHSIRTACQTDENDEFDDHHDDALLPATSVTMPEVVSDFPKKKHRIVLKKAHDRAGHNRTRKNLYN